MSLEEILDNPGNVWKIAAPYHYSLLFQSHQDKNKLHLEANASCQDHGSGVIIIDSGYPEDQRKLFYKPSHVLWYLPHTINLELINMLEIKHGITPTRVIFSEEYGSNVVNIIKRSAAWSKHTVLHHLYGTLIRMTNRCYEIDKETPFDSFSNLLKYKHENPSYIPDKRWFLGNLPSQLGRQKWFTPEQFEEEIDKLLRHRKKIYLSKTEKLSQVIGYSGSKSYFDFIQGYNGSAEKWVKAIHTTLKDIKD